MRSLGASHATAVRDRHLSAVLVELMREPSARKELAVRTGISFTTITVLAQQLIASGLVEEAAAPSTGRSRGRPRIPLRIRMGEHGKVLIGINIGGGDVACAACSLTGEVIDSIADDDVTGSPEHVMDRVAALATTLIERVGRERVLGIGVSTGGVIDFERGRVIYGPARGWEKVDARDHLTRRLGLPVALDESVRTLALLRLWWANEQAESLMVVFAQRVVSSALVIRGELYRGPGATAGDISHMPVAGGPGTPCPCGAIDCAGVVLTNTALMTRAIDQGLLPADAAHGDINATSGPAAEGLAALRRVRAAQLGETIGHLHEIIDPQKLLLVGLNTEDEVQLCLEVARRRVQATSKRTGHQIEHWPYTHEIWARASAALALDEVLRHPTGVLAEEPELPAPQLA